MTTGASAAAVILASGAGTRVGAAMNKVYLPLAGRSVVAWSLAAFRAQPGVGPLVLVIRPQDRELADRAIAGAAPGTEIVTGGATRQESELAALRHLADRIGDGALDVVLLHDAARPLVSAELIAAVLAAARADGGALPGVPADDIVRAEDGVAASALPGTSVKAQTPQGFLAAPLLAAYRQAERDGFEGTDTASCVERYTDLAVRWVPGDERNFKITYRHDLAIAERLLSSISSG